MALVAYCHGLRASEVVGLTRANVETGYLVVQRLKRSLKTKQPLIEHENPLLNERQVLFDYMAEFNRNQRLFPVTRQRFWQIIQQHAKAAGIPEHKRHPHALKHSIAMKLIGTAGIENTRQYLGHKSGSSTLEYLKVSDEQASDAAARALKV